MSADEMLARIKELEDHIARQNELIQKQMIQLAEMQIKEQKKNERKR